MSSYSTWIEVMKSIISKLLTATISMVRKNTKILRLTMYLEALITQLKTLKYEKAKKMKLKP